MKKEREEGWGNPFRLPIQSSDVLSWSGLGYMYPTVTGV
jgi:hypothetical protein